VAVAVVVAGAVLVVLAAVVATVPGAHPVSPSNAGDRIRSIAAARSTARDLDVETAAKNGGISWTETALPSSEGSPRSLWRGGPPAPPALS
jgi:hypothetical protein